MNHSLRQIQIACAIALIGFSAACADDTKDTPAQTPDTTDEMPVLASLDSVLPSDDGYANANKTEFDGKFDIIVPSKFMKLVELQSSVKNQRSRGVCSIFSTVGLMEHLYIKEGTIKNPDFSEQYLQWSAKVEAKGFPQTGGSSARVNLDAIHRFGIVTESVSPYQGNGWSESDDPECVKGEKKLPTKCYTNGDPSEEIKAEKKFFLPKGKWQSSRPKSIKTFMFKNESAVVVGLTFFYQSWSHGGSPFGINKENKASGTVVYPSKADKEKSLESRAGHSILLVGWDDDHTAPRLDEDGKPLLNEDGEPVLDKGFFIFKNSWGTGGTWGSKHPAGKGYGYLSFRYVSEYGRLMSARMPTVKVEPPKVEICGDGIDNDNNKLSDCDDAACSELSICNSPKIDTRTYSSDEVVAIPDNDKDGVMRTIEVEQDGIIDTLVLNIDISHTWIGDVSIILESPTGDLYIVKESDSSEGEDFNETITIKDFNGQKATGKWNLYVSDEAKFDDGELKTWSLGITTKK